VRDCSGYPGEAIAGELLCRSNSGKPGPRHEGHPLKKTYYLLIQQPAFARLKCLHALQIKP